MKMTITYNNAEEIKAAIDNGTRVYWSTHGYDASLTGYEVFKGKGGSYNIVWNRGGYGENAIGLTWTDGVTLNGKPEEFYSVVQAP